VYCSLSEVEGKYFTLYPFGSAQGTVEVMFFVIENVSLKVRLHLRELLMEAWNFQSLWTSFGGCLTH
jgi:hypothetical protein